VHMAYLTGRGVRISTPLLVRMRTSSVYAWRISQGGVQLELKKAKGDAKRLQQVRTPSGATHVRYVIYPWIATVIQG
jgi:hypothetical protein